jgi:hypothetical protein
MFRPVRNDDISVLIDLQRRFYASEEYPHDAVTAARAMGELIADPSLRRFFAIESAGRIVGYLAVTFGFSLEFGGRDAFRFVIKCRSCTKLASTCSCRRASS